ncbi:MAG: hypothetical protein WD739_07505 [Actinomycetota bacterium]
MMVFWFGLAAIAGGLAAVYFLGKALERQREDTMSDEWCRHERMRELQESHAR